MSRFDRSFIAYGITSLFVMLLTGAGLYVTCFYAPRPAGESLWSMMQGLSAMVATSWLVGSAVFALAQYSRSQQERHLTIYNDMFSRLMSDQQVAARRWIYQSVELTKASTQDEIAAFIKGLQPDDHAKIKLTLNAFDHLGFLVDRGWLDDAKMLGWVSPIVLKTWERLGPMIAYEREVRKDSDYYFHCEHLAQRCAQVDKRGARRHKAAALEAQDPTTWLSNAL